MQLSGARGSDNGETRHTNDTRYGNAVGSVPKRLLRMVSFLALVVVSATACDVPPEASGMVPGVGGAAPRPAASGPVLRTPVAPPTTAAPVAPPTTATPSALFDSRSESTFLNLINQERAKVRVGPLSRSADLDASARTHAKLMADRNDLHHQNLRPLLGDPWMSVAENVAYGPTVNSMHTGLVNSPGHYTNLANGSYSHVGIGVYHDGEGRIWTAHVFGGR